MSSPSALQPCHPPLLRCGLSRSTKASVRPQACGCGQSRGKHLKFSDRARQGYLSRGQGGTFCHCSEQSARGLKSAQRQERRRNISVGYSAAGLSVLLNAVQLVSSALSSTAEQITDAIPINQVTSSNYLFLADLDPATAKILIGLLGPFLSAFGFLFIARIVMSWYPKLPVGQFPYVIAYAPTEPILSVTRRLIPPVGGVDVTPVVWFGLLSFLNEILVGPQGLLVLLSQQMQ